MPRTEPDRALQRRLAVHVETCDGNVARAAETLQLSTLFIWRFLKTGKGIERNRSALRSALDLTAQTPRILGARNEKENRNGEIQGRRVAEMVGMLKVLILALEAYAEAEATPVDDTSPGVS